MVRMYSALAVGVLSVVVYYVAMYIVGRLFRGPAMVEGNFQPRFRQVAETFRRNLASGLEEGGAFAAYLDGELVLDLWGGHTDIELGHRWKRYTTANVASTTKLVASIVFAQLVEKGHVDYDKAVKEYWPEFARNGKDAITVRMLLSHQGGVIGLKPTILPEQIKEDWETVEARLAELKPLWTPGSGFAYHAYTFGLYIDALARRVDPKHRRLHQIFAEDIARPFDIEFSIGVSKPEQYRVARSHSHPFLRQLWDGVTSPNYQALVFSILTHQNSLMDANNEGIKDADKPGRWEDPDSREIPYCSGQGFGSARSLAKLLAILANGGSFKGRTLLSPTVLDDLSRVVASGYDMALKREGKRGAGVWIVNNPKGEEVFGHPGFGGQMAYVDRTNKVALVYVTNHLSVFALGDDPRFKSLEKAFYDCLDQTS